MQKQTPPEETKTVYPILRQIVNLGDGDILVADRAYTDFGFLHAHAVKRQIWTGLLVHLPLRHLKFPSKWKLGFSRLAGVVRAGVWVRRRIVRLLEMHGTAGGWKPGGAKPKPLYLQGFLPFSLSPMGQHLAKSQEIPEHGHDFLKTSLETLFHNRKNAKSKCQFRRLDLSGFAAMGCY